MAPGRAADVSQDSAGCRADSEPAGSARPDDVKLMYMCTGEGEGPVTHWWEICHSGHTLNSSTLSLIGITQKELLAADGGFYLYMCDIKAGSK